ncbi:hypothetical protein [Paenibacillus sp. 1001270B_150601_E10]|uniref:hypothetical protein n=1 Tax=Paenibacillus sp. 1001270B_150601_E10 TaxID=2787079 RepID=UPI00189D680B|nr:hypothetical protein [Paenibacillus sp. 1001270B_150601_E10]
MSCSLLEVVEHAGKYFNCWKYEMSGYLNGKGLPVDYLFYNALESTDKVYAEIMQKKKNRWIFDTTCLRQDEQLELIGVRLVRESPESFEQLASLITRAMGMNSAVMLLMDSFYVPHKEHYAKMHTPHSYIITSSHFDGSKQDHLYNLVDIVIDDYGDYPYTGSELKPMYENSQGAYRAVAYYDFESSGVIQEERILAAHLEHLDQHRDHYTLHDQVIAGLDCFTAFSDQKELLYHLDMAYTFLAGSRYLYARFLNAIGHVRASEAYAKAGEQAESLSNMLRRYGIIEEVYMDELMEECKLMRELDQEGERTVRQQAVV